MNMNFAGLQALWPFTPRRNWLTVLIVVPLAMLVVGISLSPPVLGQLISQASAARVGLKRAWFTQVDLDPSQHRIANWLLHDNLLFAVTTAGTIHALEITTGKTVWSAQVGQPEYPTLGPVANRLSVAVINGTKLMLLDRANGRLKWIRETGAASSSGPALSEDRAFIALINGRMEAFSLKDPKRPVWYHQSFGHAYHRPVTTTKSICWTTDRGALYVGRLKPLSLLFRLETGGEIVAPPTVMAPYLLVGSANGNLYCVHDQNGEERWRYSSGDSITHAPAVVGDQVFITSDAPALHVLNAVTGQLQWTTAGVTQFVALGKTHVYGADRNGQLIVLEAKTGGMVGRLSRSRSRQFSGKLISSSRGAPWSVRKPALINDQNDRIFLVNNVGLIQCLHEIGASEPVIYKQPAGETEGDAASSADEAEDVLGKSREQDAQAPTEVGQPNDASETDRDQDAITPPESAPADDNPFGEDDSNPFS
jgi:outer membrane protein assembly factor BamB